MTRSAPRSFHIKSFGCQMNAYDGDRMRDLLAGEGMAEAASTADADLVVLNTCHIRERAAEKVYSEIGRLRRDDGSQPMIAIAGCVAQAEGAEIPRRAREVDIVVGPQAYHRLPALIAAARPGKPAIDLDMPPLDAKFAALPRQLAARPSAFLTIQEGCDKFCTYCVVPYTRGGEVSRPWAAILDEARALIDGGAREITLLGQNVNAWTGEDEAGRAQGLDGLIRALDRLPGLLRIRYTTSHPRDMTDALIAAHGDVETLMPFLHLPVQSGSDRILKAMNRNHRAELFRRTVDKIRAVRPDIALSSDFIVGFPGETDAEFAETLALIEQTGFALAFSFKYSARPGTPAADMADQIDAAVMDDRLARLQALLNRQQHDFNLASVGRRTSVLLERAGKRPGQLIGKSPWLQSVVVEAAGLAIGDLIDVDIVAGGPNSLTGAAIAHPAAA